VVKEVAEVEDKTTEACAEEAVAEDKIMDKEVTITTTAAVVEDITREEEAKA
jgi:hypothetical protein